MDTNRINSALRSTDQLNGLDTEEARLSDTLPTGRVQQQTHRLKVKRWKKKPPAASRGSDTYLRQCTLQFKNYRRDKSVHDSMIKGHSQQGGRTIYVTEAGTCSYTRQTSLYLAGGTDSTITITGTSTPHFPQWTDHPDRKSTKKRQSPLHCRSDGPKGHLRDLSSNSCRIHILPQDTPCAKPRNKQVSANSGTLKSQHAESLTQRNKTKNQK